MDVQLQPNVALKKVGISQLNEMFGCLQNFYYSVYQLGYYLPEFKSATVTSEYLSGVCKGTIFCPKREKILPGGAVTVKKISKIRLYEILLDLQKKKSLGSLGFDLSKLPPKQYLLDVIQTIDPDNQIFHMRHLSNKDHHEIDFPIDIFKNIETRILPEGQGTIFKRSKEQIIKDTIRQKEEKILKKKQRLAMLVEEQKRVESNIEDIAQSIDNIAE